MGIQAFQSFKRRYNVYTEFVLYYYFVFSDKIQTKIGRNCS